MPLIPDRRSFTYIEIIVVILIVGFLAALALPQFAVTKERTLDKEAKANLLSIQEAEETYKMEKGTYYPSGTATSVISDINTNLKLGLPLNQANWTYSVDNTVSGVEKAMAVRVNSGGRTWTILFPPGSSDIPTCTGTGCP